MLCVSSTMLFILHDTMCETIVGILDLLPGASSQTAGHRKMSIVISLECPFYCIALLY